VVVGLQVAQPCLTRRWRAGARDYARVGTAGRSGSSTLLKIVPMTQGHRLRGNKKNPGQVARLPGFLFLGRRAVCKSPQAFRLVSGMAYVMSTARTDKLVVMRSSPKCANIWREGISRAHGPIAQHSAVRDGYLAMSLRCFMTLVSRSEARCVRCRGGRSILLFRRKSTWNSDERCS
jgi:hypothetical protein